MCRCKRVVCGLALAGLVAMAAGCTRRPPRIYAPSIDAAAAGARAIEMYDANKDGKLSGAELDNCPGLKASLGALGGGGNGVTAEMIADRIKAWQQTKIGRIPIGCMVRHNGKPLVGAEVMFVPEEFLGEEMKAAVATGKTDEFGSTPLSIPTSGDQWDPEGVPPGFYRVVITKPGLSIPPKYNTETVLGQEVAYEVMLQPILFDLKF